MLLPRPFHDELIGSALARGCRHYGLSVKSLLSKLAGSRRSTYSFVMGAELELLAVGMGMDARALLLDHTVFPYATAFMPSVMRGSLSRKALRASRQECIGSVSKVVTHGVPNRRLCVECVRLDLKTVGEAYWHRVHNLPGVLVCPIHNRVLMSANIPLRGRGQTGNAQLPDDVAGTPEVPLKNCEAMRAVAELSFQTLGQVRKLPHHSPDGYRKSALASGYELSSKNVATLAFTDALHNFFGHEYLLQAGCGLNGRPSTCWPALMLRPSVDVQFATPKHILMQTFLNARVACRCDARAGYRSPGPGLPDFVVIDRTLVGHLCELVIAAQIENRRLTVTELLHRSGMYERFRHHRKELPLTQQFLNEFKRSESSERQVGGRAHWCIRHPTRFGAL